ncbi:MAG: hypothetical protein RR602_11135 [Longicatena sp.]
MEWIKEHYTLIDYLFKSTELYAISDLRFGSSPRQIIPLLNKIDEEEFTIGDWKETCQYITKADCMSIQTKKQAKEILITYCNSLRK